MQPFLDGSADIVLSVDFIHHVIGLLARFGPGDDADVSGVNDITADTKDRPILERFDRGIASVSPGLKNLRYRVSLNVGNGFKLNKEACLGRRRFNDFRLKRMFAGEFGSLMNAAFVEIEGDGIVGSNGELGLPAHQANGD